MSTPQTPLAQTAAPNDGRPPLPTATRVVAVLILVFAGISLLSLLSQYRTIAHLRLPVLGMLVGPAVGIAFTVALGLANLVLAILVLRRFAWALDGLIAVQIVSVVNNCLYLLSPARSAYVSAVFARTQVQMPVQPAGGLDPNVFRTILSVAMSVGIIVSLLFSAVFIALLAAYRRKYRAVSLSRES
jgi:hypothetical protein